MLLCAAVFSITSHAKVGDTFASGNINYKVTTENGTTNEAIVYSPLSAEISSATIPSSVSYSGITYKVAGIGHKAFENCINLILMVNDSYFYRFHSSHRRMHDLGN